MVLFTNSVPVADRAVLDGWIKKQTRLLFCSPHQIRFHLFLPLPASLTLVTERNGCEKDHGDELWMPKER